MQDNSKKALLGELESIIGILDDNEQAAQEHLSIDKHRDEIMDIPLLNDVVTEQQEELPPTLLDLDRIFSDDLFEDIPAPDEQPPVYSKLDNGEEEQSEMFPVPNAKTETPSRKTNLQLELDLVIQELVDEFIPLLEDRLRERLSALSPEIIQQLAEKHLNQ